MPNLKVQVVKWGNSHAVRIPKTVLDRAELREGDQLEVRVEDRRISLEPAVPKLKLRDLVARITPQNLHAEQDWGRPVGREIW
jgi:antitoxin MazE